jgi:PAS domain S-box-containing protein
MPSVRAPDFFSILHEIPFSACITNSAHEFVAVNDAFCRLYCLRPHDLLGKTPWVIATVDFSQELSKDIADSVSEKGWWSGRITNRRSDGARLKLHLAALKLSPEKGPAPQKPGLRLGVVVQPEDRDALLNFSLSLNAELAGNRAMPHSAKLTGRQTEVVRLTRAGLRTKEVAGVLGISASTVRVHVSAAKKLHPDILC